MNHSEVQHPPDHNEYKLICGNQNAIILVHGIVGSPAQFRFLAEALHREGFDCFGLLLPGHGGTAKDFYLTKKGEWQDYMNEVLKAYISSYNNVYLVGHSLGGLLCLNAASHGSFAGVVLINTPVAFKFSVKQLSLSFKVLFSTSERDDELLSAYRAANSIGRSRLFEYPLWIKQFVHLIQHMSQTKRLFRDIRTNVLIVQSKKDESVASRSLSMISKGLVNCTTKQLILPQSYHGFFPEADRRSLIEEIIYFIQDNK